MTLAEIISPLPVTIMQCYPSSTSLSTTAVSDEACITSSTLQQRYASRRSVVTTLHQHIANVTEDNVLSCTREH